MVISHDYKEIKIILVKSSIGTKRAHRKILQGLGLKKLNGYSILKDTPEVRGMISKVNYLIKCENLCT